MKKIYIFFLVVIHLVVITSLASLYSDDFLIGVYSNLKSYDDYIDSISSKVREAGFNALGCKTVYHTGNEESENMFNILDNNSLDAIYSDLIFYPNSDPNLEKYGYAALSTGINMRFEAEYAGCECVNQVIHDTNNDRFFYMSPRNQRVGEFDSLTGFSNQHYWLVSDSTGYAYKDIIYRWRKENATTYKRVGNEFRILGNFTNGVHILENNSLKISFVFRVDELESYSGADTLAVFNFVKHNNDTTVSNTDYSFLDFYHSSTSDAIQEYALTKDDYFQLPIINTDFGLRSIEFEFPVGGEINSLKSQNVVEAHGWHWMIKNLNPWMYWNGKGVLRLDYIEYKDKIFEDYIDNEDKLAKLRSFEGSANLKYFSGIDEPKAPHFKSFRQLKEHLIDSFPIDERYLITAVNLDNHNIVKPDLSPYRLPMAYLEVVEPRIMLIDVYPFTGMQTESARSVSWEAGGNPAHLIVPSVVSEEAGSSPKARDKAFLSGK